MHDFDRYDINGTVGTAMIGGVKKRMTITGGPGTIRDARSELITVKTVDEVTGNYGIETTIRTTDIVDLPHISRVKAGGAGIPAPTSTLSHTKVAVYINEDHDTVTATDDTEEVEVETCLDNGHTWVIGIPKIYADGSFSGGESKVVYDSIDGKLVEDYVRQLGTRYKFILCIQGKTIEWYSFSNTGGEVVIEP